VSQTMFNTIFIWQAETRLAELRKSVMIGRQREWQREGIFKILSQKPSYQCCIAGGGAAGGVAGRARKRRGGAG